MKIMKKILLHLFQKTGLKAQLGYYKAETLFFKKALFSFADIIGEQKIRRKGRCFDPFTNLFFVPLMIPASENEI